MISQVDPSMVISYIPPQDGISHGEHTADLWLKARGRTFEEMTARMIQGIYGVMASRFQLEDNGDEDHFEVTGKDIETTFVDLLSEVLFLFDADSVVIIDPELETILLSCIIII